MRACVCVLPVAHQVRSWARNARFTNLLTMAGAALRRHRAGESVAEIQRDMPARALARIIKLGESIRTRSVCLCRPVTDLAAHLARCPRSGFANAIEYGLYLEKRNPVLLYAEYRKEALSTGVEVMHPALPRSLLRSCLTLRIWSDSPFRACTNRAARAPACSPLCRSACNGC